MNTHLHRQHGLGLHAVLYCLPILHMVLIPPSAGLAAEAVPWEVTPAAIVVQHRRLGQQILVTAVQPAPPSVRAQDITRDCQFTILNPEIAQITPSGYVTGLQTGTTELQINWQNQHMTLPVRISLPPTAPVHFQREVMPILTRLGCNSGPCHGNLHGKGGFKLSLRGEAEIHDFWEITRAEFGRRINQPRPTQSLLLQKPTGLLPHEGGLRLPADSEAYAALVEWIRGGAQWSASASQPNSADHASQLDPAAVVTDLLVKPGDAFLVPTGRSQQLQVTATFQDGQQLDVTRLAAFDSSEPLLVQISPTGLVTLAARVTAADLVDVLITVRYRQGRAATRLVFLPDRPATSEIVLSPTAPTAPTDPTDPTDPTEATNPETIDTAVLQLDRLVTHRLQDLRLQSAGPASSTQWLRRLYLVALGVPPQPEEVRAFLQDQSPQRRHRWVERVLARPEFAEFWALKWADVLRAEEKTMGTKGVQRFQRWLVQQVDQNVPLPEIAAQLVTGTGSTWQQPSANFHRTNADPTIAAESTAQVFYGVRLQCARCHNHPFDVWTQTDYYSLSAYFAPVQNKQLNNVRRDKLDTHEINGDVYVYLDGKPTWQHPVTKQDLAPKPLRGPSSNHAEPQRCLQDLAVALRRDRQVARNFANRLWYHVFHRGVVDPPDDFRDSNPPSDPILLEWLTDHFQSVGGSIRPFVRTILLSETFARDSQSAEPLAVADRYFVRWIEQQLSAEVLLDTVSTTLAVPTDFPNTPFGTRAVQLPGVVHQTPFLQVFGKPERLLTCDCERSDAITLAQAFQMINGELIQQKLQHPDNRFAQRIAAEQPPAKILEELFLASLSRLPTTTERAYLLDYYHERHHNQQQPPRQVWQDICWSLLNSKEFLLIQ